MREQRISMKSMVPNTLLAFIGLFLASVNAAPTLAQETQPKPAQIRKAATPVTEIRLVYLRAYEPQLALSVLDVPPRETKCVLK